MTTLPDSSNQNVHKRHHIFTPDELSQRAGELKNLEYLIDGLIPKQGISITVGDSGLGKSPLLYQGAICVAAGMPFLGRPIRQGPVLYMDCENGLVQVEEVVGRISTFLGLRNRPADLHLWNLNDCAEQFGQAGYGFHNIIEDVQPAWVIVDPLNAIFAGIEHDNTRTTEIYKHLRQLMSKYHFSLTGTHHIRKPDEKGPKTPSLDSTDFNNWFFQTRGPRALINGADVRIGVDRPSGISDDSQLVLGGFERVYGTFPLIRLKRVLGEDGDPVGYEQLSGADLLKDPHQRDAFHRLPDSFRFKEAMSIYDRKDQATKDFLNKCISAGIVRKPAKGIYEKVKFAPEEEQRAA